MESFKVILIIFYLIYFLFVFGLAITAYILRSLGLYTIATRRGIKNPWFSWLPVVNQYLLGCISDQYQYVVKGKVTNRRKVMLGLNIAMCVLYILFWICYIWLFVAMIQMAVSGGSEDMVLQAIGIPFVSAMVICMPIIGISIASMVFHYIAMYDVYSSCNPKNNVLFLVLSIVFSVTEPFFVFFNRKRDDGMIPQKPAVRYEIPQPEAPAEARNNTNAQ